MFLNMTWPLWPLIIIITEFPSAAEVKGRMGQVTMK